MQKYHSEVYDQTMTHPGNQTTISSETNRDPQNAIEETRRHSKQSTKYTSIDECGTHFKTLPSVPKFLQQLNKSIPGYRIHIFSQFPAHTAQWDVHHIRGGLICCGDSSEKLYKATPDYQQHLPG